MPRPKNDVTDSSETEGSTSVAHNLPVDSSDLPSNIVRVKNSPYLHIYAPTSAGVRKRIGTGIRDNARGVKLAESALHRLEDLYRDGARRAVLDFLHNREIGLFPNEKRWPGLPGLQDVLATNGPTGVDPLIAQFRAKQHDLDLAPLLTEFANDNVSLHPRKSGHVMKSNARSNDAAHVRATLDWCALDAGVDCAELARLEAIADKEERRTRLAAKLASLGPERRLSLLSAARVNRYLKHVFEREKARKLKVPDAGRSARRKHHLALRTFVKWLKARQGVDWAVDPTSLIILESTPKGRIFHLEHWEIEMLAATLDSIDLVHGDYCRIQHGTGLDTTDLARLEVRDVDFGERRIRGLSGKTFNRMRRVLVLDWAWEAVERRAAGKKQTDRLFAELPPDRHAHSKALAKARRTLVEQGHRQFEGYQPRDARHSVAVMMLAAGVPVKAVARQLGHDPATLLRTYAEWVPDPSDEALWREQIAVRDARKRAEAQHP